MKRLTKEDIRPRVEAAAERILRDVAGSDALTPTREQLAAAAEEQDLPLRDENDPTLPTILIAAFSPEDEEAIVCGCTEIWVLLQRLAVRYAGSCT